MINHKERFKNIIFMLNQFELTAREKHFVVSTNETLDRNGGLTEQQESILRGMFREKRKWGKRVFPPVKTGLPNSSQSHP